MYNVGDIWDMQSVHVRTRKVRITSDAEGGTELAIRSTRFLKISIIVKKRTIPYLEVYRS